MINHLTRSTSSLLDAQWNKIEHRLFSYISMNSAGRPLTSHDVVVNLIAGTTTRTGLTIQARRDDSTYPRGITIPDRDMKDLAKGYLQPHNFHGEWNYYTYGPSVADWACEPGPASQFRPQYPVQAPG